MSERVGTGLFAKKPLGLTSLKRSKKVVKASSTLYCGAMCNDGRPITESFRYKEAIRLGAKIIHLADTVTQDNEVDDVSRKLSQLLLKEKKVPFVTKYAPKTVADIIGNKEPIKVLMQFLKEFPSTKEKAVILSGPPGIGKTTAAHLAAKECGYFVVEYNASDIRSISMLKGAIGLGMTRLRKEVIIMDEVDGLSERGSSGELADLIKKTPVPIICIANEREQKLKPLIGACMDIKFSRPMPATIVNALLPIVKAEELLITKQELEVLCTKNGNDIRSMLNTLEFGTSAAEKDGSQRMDMFSATGRLFGAKRALWTDAEDFVYVDYTMVPLMVQEGYVHAGQDDMDAISSAAEMCSSMDLVQTQVMSTQEWGLLPLLVANTVAITRTVKGNAPFQLFPSVLGKMSKRAKHTSWLQDMGRRVSVVDGLRMDYFLGLKGAVFAPLLKGDIKGTLSVMDKLGLTRDDVLEALMEIGFYGVDIPTKIKSALTREWNKCGSIKCVKKSDKLDEEDEADEAEEDLY